LLKKIIYPSSKFEARPSEVRPDLVVLHYTDMLTAEEALTRLCDLEAKVSCHFLISKEGDLYQLVDPKYRAWHAGVSSWQGAGNINCRSIGIELDNPGHTHGLKPFPAPQIEALLILLKEITKTYNIPAHHIVGHSDVAPLRKKDPGELFPWHKLAQKGFGLWPLTLPINQALSLDPLRIQKALSQIGYECPKTGTWDEDSQEVCRAFQRHFIPHELTGHPSVLVGQTLKGLLRKLEIISRHLSNCKSA